MTKVFLRSATIAALGVIHHYLMIALNWSLGTEWKPIAQGVGIFTSGGFALMVAFELYEMVMAFAPWREPAIDADVDARTELT